MRTVRLSSNIVVYRLLSASFALPGLISLVGCGGSSASNEELGEVHYYLPPIKGMETRYYLPPLMQAKSEQKSIPADAEKNSAETSTIEATSAFDENPPPVTTGQSSPASAIPTSDAAITETDAGETGSVAPPIAPAESGPEKTTAPEKP